MVKEVIVLESLYRINTDQSKSKNRKVPVSVAKQILEEYKELAKAEQKGPLALQERINKLKINDNGKKMASVTDIFKYRLNSGDRILYTYSKNIPYLKRKHPSALVLLQYEQHDKQGLDAKNFQLAQVQKYKKVTELVDDLDEFSVEDLSDDDLVEIFAMLDPAFIENSGKYVVSEDMAKNLDCKDWDVILVPSQDEIKKEFENEGKRPMLVLGGAGSGKTVLATHILGDFNGDRALYLTQSNELRRKTEAVFRGIYPGRDNIEFYNINDFCWQILGFNHRYYKHFDDFCGFIESNSDAKKLLVDSSLTPFDIWTEIRGTIKGSLNNDWSRYDCLNQVNYKYTDDLIRRGYLCRPYNDKKFRLTDKVDILSQKLKDDESFMSGDEEEVKELQSILKYFAAFDSSIAMMPEQEYLQLPEESSTIEIEKRGIAYQVCSMYMEWLGTEYFDDNDLARRTIGKINLIEDKYDLIVVDEVQDYTEMQLYLTYLLSKSNSMFFAGDEHQLINPTMFRESRLNELFYHSAKTRNLTVRHLTSNFRCQQGIVDVANEFAEIRKKTVGSRSAAGEQLQKSSRDGSNPFRLAYTEDNLKDIIDILLRYPKTAILVSDDTSKMRLIELIGKDKYQSAQNSIIFTIPEIKGMEYRYVLCYDLFGSNHKMWDEVTLNKKYAQNTRLRFRFNLIYVAMTRAQDNLCFIDSNLSSKIEQNLSLLPVEKFDISKLEIGNLVDSLEEWLDAAEEYEANGNYSQAIENYIRAQAPEEHIYRCKSADAYEKHDYELSLKYAILALDNDLIQQAYKNLDDSAEIKRLYDALDVKPKKLGEILQDISKMIRSCYKGFNEEETLKVFEWAISAIDTRIESEI